MRSPPQSGWEANMPAIVSYKVGVTRSHKTGPVRWITLKLDPDSNEGPGSASLFFYEGQPPALGFLNRRTSTAIVNLPLADFGSIYDIVNKEKPVYFYFRIQGPDHHLLSFDVSTSEEPVGEGPVDTSP
jgi:hypothetical protein